MSALSQGKWDNLAAHARSNFLLQVEISNE